MFKWLRGVVDGVRVTLDYPEFERECRRDWEADARERFSTAHLEAEVTRRMAESRSRAYTLFEQPMESMRAELRSLRTVVDDANSKLAVLTRNYQAELNTAYAAFNALQEELSACRRALEGAYIELDEAKSGLDAWYRRAEGNWIGNGGKQLPDRSIFGQSLGDRDRLKNQRDSAARSVGRYKEQRTVIQKQLNGAHAKITQIKTEREAMHHLRNQGFDLRVVKSTLRTASAELQKAEGSIAKSTSAMHDYLLEAKKRAGVMDLEQEIWRLKRTEEQRIATFESAGEVARRKAKHRQMWLVAHGRG